MRFIDLLINGWYYFRVQLQQHGLMKPLSILSSTVATGISIFVGFLFIKYSFAGYFESLIKSMGYGNVIGFVVTGSLLSILYQGLLNSVTFSLQDERRWGTLELLMLSGEKFFLFFLFFGRLLFGLMRYGIVLLSITVMVIVFFGSWINIQANIPVLILSLILLIAATFFQGIVAQSIVIQSRKINPLYAAILTLLNWFSGVTLPVEIFPRWIQIIVYMSPLTPGLKAVRRSLFSNGVNIEVDISILISQLIAYFMIATVFSLNFIEKALKRGEVTVRA